jgi:hypothetical protein
MQNGPLASRTMKQAAVSSAVQGGGAELCSGVIRRLHRHGQADKGEWSNRANWRL